MQVVFNFPFWRVLIFSLASGVLINGCSSTDGRTQSYIARAINLVSDSPSQSIDVGSLNFASVFSSGTGYSSAFAASGSIETRGFVPNADPGQPLDDTLILSAAETIEFSDRTAYTIINYGTVADFRSITVASPVLETVDPASNIVRFVHAALGVGSLDVYLTDPDADLGAASPQWTLSSGQTGELQTVAFGTHQIRVTASGTSTVIYDSGPITAVLPGRLLYVIGKSVGPSPTPIFLNQWYNQGDSNAIADINSPAFVRLMHLSPDSAALDLISEDNYQAPLASNIAFRGISGYGEARDTIPDGTVVLPNTPIDFIGNATDAEDGDLTSAITWTSSIDGPLTGSGATINATLSTGNHALIASVTDAGGLVGSEAITMNVLPTAGAAPQVTISRPPSRTMVASGTALTFTGSANDVTDGDLSASLLWASNIDGPLPDTGASVTAILSPGIHAITASTADNEGVVGSETITVSVTTAGNTAAIVNITQPDISSIEFDVTLNSDPDTVLIENAQQIFNAVGYSYIVAGAGADLSSIVIADAVQPVATHSLLRVIHASLVLPAVDVYITQAGTGIAGVTPVASGLTFSGFTGSGSFASGDYDITMTEAGNSNVLLAVPALTLSNGQINTFVLLEDDGASAPDFQLFTD